MAVDEQRLWPMLAPAIRGDAGWWKAHRDASKRFPSEGQAIDYCLRARNSDSVVHHPLDGRSANKPWLAEGILMSALSDADARREVSRIERFHELHPLGTDEFGLSHHRYPAWTRCGMAATVARLLALGESSIALFLRDRLDAEGCLLALAHVWDRGKLRSCGVGARGIVSAKKGGSRRTNGIPHQPYVIPDNPYLEDLVLLAARMRDDGQWPAEVAEAIDERWGLRENPMVLLGSLATDAETVIRRDDVHAARRLVDFVAGVASSTSLPGALTFIRTVAGAAAVVEGPWDDPDSWDRGDSWDTGSTPFLYYRAYSKHGAMRPREFPWDDGETRRYVWGAPDDISRRSRGRRGEAELDLDAGVVRWRRDAARDHFHAPSGEWRDGWGEGPLPPGRMLWAVSIGPEGEVEWLAGGDSPPGPPTPEPMPPEPEPPADDPPPPPTPAPTGRPTIIAGWFPWDDREDAARWEDRMDRFPLLGRVDGEGRHVGYDQTDPDTIAAELHWMQAAGVGAVGSIVRGWPDDSMWERATGPGDVMASRPELAGMRWCYYLGNITRRRNTDFNDAEVRQNFEGAFERAAEQYQHPHYLHQDGRPVILVHFTWTYSGPWRAALERVRDLGNPYVIGASCRYHLDPHDAGLREHVEAFDAVTSWSALSGSDRAASPDLEDVAAWLRPQLAAWRDYVEGEVGVGFVPTISGQYDATGLGRSERAVRYATRREGFVAMARAAAQHLGSPNLVWLQTGNEWAEGSAWSPTEDRRGGEYRDRYGFDALRALAEVFG